MTAADEYEQIVRRAYQVAEEQNVAGWIESFTPDGVFIDESTTNVYRGSDEAGVVAEAAFTAFSDMHRELHDFHVVGNTVVVRLALQGTHDGPFHSMAGVIPPTGKRIDAPCCDVFEIEDGKIKSFDCYPSHSVMLRQVGALPNSSG